MEKNLAFRAWFYFREGWGKYFAFIIAAVNTLTVTYFLAVENYPFLTEIFPSFLHYVVSIILLGVPCVLLVGYVHWKKSAGFKAEADIHIEANPHMRRTLMNTEVLLSSYLQLLDLIIKLSQNEKLSQEELNQISKLQTDLGEHINQRQIR